MSRSPISERVEFHDDGWVNAFRELVSRRVSEWSAELTDVNFTLSERYENAPPHLGFPGNVSAITVRFQGASVTVERGFDPSADRVVEGEYQLNLPIAQAVSPVGVERAIKLTQHLYGDRATRVSGSAPERRVALTLQEAHDYLARRTLENPDLEHRIAAQGLSRYVEELKENGYTIIEKAISDEHADELCNIAVDELLSHGSNNEPPSGLVFYNGTLTFGRPYEEIAQHPTLRTVLESAVGKGMVLQTTAAQVKGPGAGVVAPHVDISYVPEPYPEFPMLAVSVWNLDGDWTAESGATYILPGSHKFRRQPTPEDNLDGAVAAEMPKGSVVIFADAWHWQGARTQPGNRVSLHNAYQQPFIRQVDDYSNVDTILHRNSPVLSTLTGHDDYYGSGYWGSVDAERAAYMDKLVGDGRTFDAMERSGDAATTIHKEDSEVAEA